MRLTSPSFRALQPPAARWALPSVVADYVHAFTHTRLGLALLFSQGTALAWWSAAAWVRTLNLIPVWFDQEIIFTQLLHHTRDPYAIVTFMQPPWAGVVMAPLGLLPLPLSVLAQLCLYFAVLTLLIFRFGGGLGAVLITLTSFVAFDNAIELSMDWTVCLGLLLPPALGGPLLLLKPQLALGTWLSLRGRTLAWTIIVSLLTVLLSLALWPGWPVDMAHGMQFNLPRQVVNMAPLAHLPPQLSFAIGLGLAWQAVRRRDAAWGLWAWLFFVPYLTFYSLMLHLAVLAARNWRLALLISALIWLIYGGVLAVVLMRM